ncbi:peptidase [Flavobacteriales bacterium 34_180_T64]|nr:peptidase [Flavobacteriales bacterium 34_180_T64]
MKNYILIVSILSCFVSCKSSHQNESENATKTTASPLEYGNTITSSELKDLLYTYASDEFEGRETGEPGQKKAVEFLKQQYLTLGISSPPSETDYFQDVPLVKQFVPEIEFILNGESATMFDEFVSVGTADTQVFTADEIVYVGYGIETDSYSDYNNIDVKNKVVLIKAGEAQNKDGTYVTSGATDETVWSSGRRARNAKRDIAKEKGAKAVLVVDNLAHAYYSKYYSKLAESGKSGRVSLVTKDKNMLMFLISEALGQSMFREILTSNSAQIIKTDLSLTIKNKTEPVSSENVVAFIKGSEKPNEFIVVSAHLDHEGIRGENIYNGADDDGSGTVALLEMAEAFQTAVKNGDTPKRSIVFLHVTAEERGLLGSRHYTDNDPIFPLEQTVANLNIDMIGRVDKLHTEDRNYVYAIGSDRLSEELKVISEVANNTYTKITLDYRYDDEKDKNRYYYRSDHYNFAKHNVPVIFYFNGSHDDYHKPTDTPDKIEYDLLENRTRLVFYTAWELANREDRITVDEKHTVKTSE